MAGEAKKVRMDRFAEKYDSVYASASYVTRERGCEWYLTN